MVLTGGTNLAKIACEELKEYIYIYYNRGGEGGIYVMGEKEPCVTKTDRKYRDYHRTRDNLSNENP